MSYGVLFTSYETGIIVKRMNVIFADIVRGSDGSITSVNMPPMGATTAVDLYEQIEAYGNYWYNDIAKRDTKFMAFEPNSDVTADTKLVCLFSSLFRGNPNVGGRFNSTMSPDGLLTDSGLTAGFDIEYNSPGLFGRDQNGILVVFNKNSSGQYVVSYPFNTPSSAELLTELIKVYSGYPLPPSSPDFTPETGFGSLGMNTVSAFALPSLRNFADSLWGKDLLTELKNWFTNPLDSIIRVNKLPVSPPVAGLGYVYLGDVQMDTQPRNVIMQQFVTYPVGTVTVPRTFDNFLDYNPYTTVQIYLPFIGFQELRADDVIGKEVELKYNIDVLTGDCIALISVNNVLLYQFSGNCSIEIPLSTSSRNIGAAISTGLTAVTGVASIAAGVATGTVIPMLALAGTQLGTSLAAGAVESSGRMQSRSGSIKGNMGFCTSLKPYFLISHPVLNTNSGYPHLKGYPSNYYSQLGGLSGFTVVDKIHVEGLTATDDEKSEIERLLKEGVIL